MPRGAAEDGPTVSREVRVAGRRVIVLDGVLDAQATKHLDAHARRLPYVLNDVDSQETGYSRHWKYDLSATNHEDSPFKELGELTRGFFPDRELTLARIHFNLHQYGDVQFPHQDSGGDGVTFLLYLNREWKPSWMGETVFYENAEEPVVTEGAIIHRAGVAQRECFEPRISLALKFRGRRAR
jgi:hypothetical protein